MKRIAEAVARHFGLVRRDLPWRRTRDPYAIWISEIMLQQTRVATVIPYWERWMARFPTARDLAAAPLDDVLAAWAGLGYYSRARNLKKGAEAIGDVFPSRASELRGVPGIGPYTAGAIASIAFGERTPLVDGNVSRVLARVFGIALDIKSTAGAKAIWAKAGELMDALPAELAPGDLNQGLMELGATTCTPTSPRCLLCPLAKLCVARRDDRIDELPVVPKRKKPHELPLLAWEALWMQDDRGVVLARRTPGGLFGGLWELPPVGLLPALPGDIVAYHDQVLTHRRLALTVRVAAAPATLGASGDPAYDSIAFVPLADLPKRGIALATAAITAKYEADPWTLTQKPSPSSSRATRRSSKASASSATTSPTPTSRRPRAAPRRASTSSSTTSTRSTPRSKR